MIYPRTRGFAPLRTLTRSQQQSNLRDWIRTFTTMKYWVSDQGSQFLKNVVMKKLAQEHNIRDLFTVAYSPWVNGTVEKLHEAHAGSMQSIDL